MNHTAAQSEPYHDILPPQLRKNVAGRVTQEVPGLMIYDIKFIGPEQLDSQSKLILMVFLSMRNLDEIFISNRQLSDQTSISVSTLKRRMKDLEDMGILDREKRIEGRTLATTLNEKRITELVCKSKFVPIKVKERLQSSLYYLTKLDVAVKDL